MSKNIKISNLFQNKFWVRQVTRITNKNKKNNPTNPYLTESQKRELFYKYKNEGCLKSRDLLLSTLYPLVLQEVHKKINKYNSEIALNVEDLEQEGNIALLMCLDKWNPEEGTLATYFRSQLPGNFFPALKEYLNIVPNPDNRIKLNGMESKAYDQFFRKHGRTPLNGESFEYIDNMGQTTLIVFGNQYLHTTVSANTPVCAEDDSVELMDIFTSDDEFGEKIENDQREFFLKKALSKLTDREKEVINFAFFSELEQSEIVCKLKPRSKSDYKKLYQRGENIIKIITDKETIEYIFYVYEHAKKRTKGHAVKTDNFVPISHFNAINYQNKNYVGIEFKLIDCKIVSVQLNGKEFNQITLKNDIFKINVILKRGAIFTVNNYHNIVKKTIDKMRYFAVQSKFEYNK